LSTGERAARARAEGGELLASSSWFVASTASTPLPSAGDMMGEDGTNDGEPSAKYEGTPGVPCPLPLLQRALAYSSAIEEWLSDRDGADGLVPLGCSACVRENSCELLLSLSLLLLDEDVSRSFANGLRNAAELCTRLPYRSSAVTLKEEGAFRCSEVECDRTKERERERDAAMLAVSGGAGVVETIERAEGGGVAEGVRSDTLSSMASASELEGGFPLVRSPSALRSPPPPLDSWVEAVPGSSAVYEKRDTSLFECAEPMGGGCVSGSRMRMRRKRKMMMMRRRMKRRRMKRRRMKRRRMKRRRRKMRRRRKRRRKTKEGGGG
jgi:hypothetical protein